MSKERICVSVKRQNISLKYGSTQVEVSRWLRSKRITFLV